MEVRGTMPAAGGSSRRPGEDVLAGVDESLVRRAAEAALCAAGLADGHLAIAFVAEEEIRRLNGEQRDRDAATDVLSFPIDGRERAVGPRELGDVVICPQRTEDVVRAVVHGVLHLCGYDHERDEGDMVALEERVVASLR